MKTKIFDFDLPQESIAQQPISPRHMAKLLHINNHALSDHHAIDLPDLLNEHDLLIFNNTKVIPSRLFGYKDTGARIEIMLHKSVSHTAWRAFAKPAKKLKEGTELSFGPHTPVTATIVEKFDAGEVLIQFHLDDTDMMPWLEECASLPLPPYIRGGIAEEQDSQHYQTIYAKNDGAVAAPTAGLHFTSELFDRLDAHNIQHCEVTLHVGAGTFLPVKVDDIHDHVMHSEWGSISQEAADKIMQTKHNGGRVYTVGTTSLRVLESAASAKGEIQAWHGDTNIFIYPGYEFKIIDGLLTNFHLPQSTLFMLVSAIAGLEQMHTAYQYAIENNYRFYSYGDCCLLHVAN